MDTDEQVQEVADTSVETSLAEEPEQTEDSLVDSEDTESELDENSSDESDNRGDLRTALHQARAKLNDPDVVYRQAVKLGLVDAGNASQPTDTLTPEYVNRIVESKLDYQEAVRQFPELAKDKELKAWAGALVEQGKTHTQAAKIIQKRLGVLKEAAKVEGAIAKEKTITDKEQAVTAATSRVTNSQETSKVDSLRKTWKNYSLPKTERDNAFAQYLVEMSKQPK